LHSSIPLVAAMAITILGERHLRRQSYPIKMVLLILFFLPFYLTCAQNDWKFTYFDVFPNEATTTIETGFGRGIKTNALYLDLYEWIRSSAERYSHKDDYLIAYTVAPMVYMIAKRRPALDHSWTSIFAKPRAFYERSIAKMKRHGRHPALAFVFESWPGFYPKSLDRSQYLWYSKEFSFEGDDPVSTYIRTNMELVGKYIISKDTDVKLFRRRQAQDRNALLRSD
jgi:hypothetical protein